MVCDAYLSETGADLSYQNAGGVRIESHEAGDMTMGDVMKMDPFQNDAVEVFCTGKELAAMLISCYNNDKQRFPYVGGFTCEVTYDPADGEDEETGIQTVNASMVTPGDSGWHIIDGRKLDGKPSQRGIYINNGRKVLVRDKR